MVAFPFANLNASAFFHAFNCCCCRDVLETDAERNRRRNTEKTMQEKQELIWKQFISGTSDKVCFFIIELPRLPLSRAIYILLLVLDSSEIIQFVVCSVTYVCCLAVVGRQKITRV